MPPPDVISKYKSETNMSWTEFAMFVEKLIEKVSYGKHLGSFLVNFS